MSVERGSSSGEEEGVVGLEGRGVPGARISSTLASRLA